MGKEENDTLGKVNDFVQSTVSGVHGVADEVLGTTGFGNVAIGLNIALETVEVIAAEPEDRPKEIAGAVGGLGGGIIAGAALGATFGPLGALGGGILGSLLGETAVEGVIDADAPIGWQNGKELYSGYNDRLGYDVAITGHTIAGIPTAIETLLDPITGAVVSQRSLGPVDPATMQYFATGGAFPGHNPGCFLAGTPIAIWPDNLAHHCQHTEDFDESFILSNLKYKSIEEVEVNDTVLSYDKNGKLRPGRVAKLFRKKAAALLDVFGLKITPGHVTLCGDGRFENQYVPILDILRSDGCLVREDGKKVRAGTGCDLGSEGDQLVWATVGDRQANGKIKIIEASQIRVGTRVILEGGQDVSVLELINENGGELTDDGLVRNSSSNLKLPFRWTFSPKLPKPEDYVLKRSAVSLLDIYEADEWESIGPKLPAPVP